MSQPITQPETPEVEFMCAGAKFTAKNNTIKGSFHPIPFSLWQAIIGFHRRVALDYHGESVSYHRWSDKDKAYHTIIPFQKTRRNGLSVDVDWTTKENQELLDEYARLYGEDFLPACSIHTHVDVSAFESGTDANDEKTNPGWHITLGHLISSETYDFHFRMRLPRLRRIRDVVNVEQSVTLDWEHLFADTEENRSMLEITPGTTDFHKFLNRIQG